MWHCHYVRPININTSAATWWANDDWCNQDQMRPTHTDWTRSPSCIIVVCWLWANMSPSSADMSLSSAIVVPQVPVHIVVIFVVVVLSTVNLWLWWLGLPAHAYLSSREGRWSHCQWWSLVGLRPSDSYYATLMLYFFWTSAIVLCCHWQVKLYIMYTIYKPCLASLRQYVKEDHMCR